ncbi:hypothetical protein ABIC28_001599 [Rhodococcus sp. PvR044]|uniref:TnsA-like heteromeric transposase endonuclease subunit n=1 Tax=Rhodococcus sp. PvR044 TaxID=3156402 RepID=UPI0033947A78
MTACIDGPVIRILNDDGSMAELPLDVVGVAELSAARPIRSLSWYPGQRSFPGWYWSLTMRAHVPYDSRLELARLLLADFDPAVETIVAQPFQIAWPHQGELRRQIPDFVLIHTDQIVTVVNVKTEEALKKAKVRETFAWVTELLAAQGWRHEVWSGVDPALLSNVRFLAGFRREHYPTDLLDLVEHTAPGGTFLATEVAISPRWDRREVRSAILHLLWTHTLCADLSEPLSSETVLEKAR